MESMLQLDHQLLVFINKSLQNSFFDIVMPLVRNRYVWLPVYVAIVAAIFSTFNIYKAYYYLIFIIFAVTLTDVISGNLMKKLVQRERPCRTIDVRMSIETRVHCSSSYAFPSAHAANHFGLSLMLCYLFFRKNRKWQILLFGWASLICFAQIYVGVHYPLDILGGIVLGLAIVRIYIALIFPIIFKLEQLPVKEVIV